MTQISNGKKIMAVVIAVAVVVGGIFAIKGCVKSDEEKELDQMTAAMRVFETGEISTPQQLTAVLATKEMHSELKGDIVDIVFTVPDEVADLDIVKRKAFGKDGSRPLPQITEFEAYMQTDCNVDDTGWHWSDIWDAYPYDGSNNWGETAGSYVGTSGKPYNVEMWLSSSNRIPRSGEQEVSCLDYIKDGNSCFLDSVIVTDEDGAKHYDLENHTVLYRHRFLLKYVENGENKVIISDWSEPAWLNPEPLGR